MAGAKRRTQVDRVAEQLRTMGNRANKREYCHWIFHKSTTNPPYLQTGSDFRCVQELYASKQLQRERIALDRHCQSFEVVENGW